MKSGFLLIVPVLGTIICATYAGPINPEIQTLDDDTTSQINLLKLIDHIASQQRASLDDSQHVLIDFFSNAMRSAKNFDVRRTAQLLNRFSEQAQQEAAHFMENNGKHITNGVGRLNGQTLREVGRFQRNNGKGIAQAVGGLTGLALAAGGGESLGKGDSSAVKIQAAISEGMQPLNTGNKDSIKKFDVKRTAQLLNDFSEQAQQEAAHSMENSWKQIAKRAGHLNGQDLGDAGRFLPDNRKGIAQAVGGLTGLALAAGGGESLGSTESNEKELQNTIDALRTWIAEYRGKAVVMLKRQASKEYADDDDKIREQWRETRQEFEEWIRDFITKAKEILHNVGVKWSSEEVIHHYVTKAKELLHPGHLEIDEGRHPTHHEESFERMANGKKIAILNLQFSIQMFLTSAEKVLEMHSKLNFKDNFAILSCQKWMSESLIHVANEILSTPQQELETIDPGMLEAMDGLQGLSHP